MTPLPDPTPPANPEPTAPPAGYRPLADLVGRTVVLTADHIADVDGIPVIAVDGAWYLCTNEWASRGATYLQAEIASSGRESITVKVVEEHGKAGFRE